MSLPFLVFVLLFVVVIFWLPFYLSNSIHGFFHSVFFTGTSLWCFTVSIFIFAFYIFSNSLFYFITNGETNIIWFNVSWIINHMSKSSFEQTVKRKIKGKEKKRKKLAHTYTHTRLSREKFINHIKTCIYACIYTHIYVINCNDVKMLWMISLRFRFQVIFRIRLIIRTIIFGV